MNVMVTGYGEAAETTAANRRDTNFRATVRAAVLSAVDMSKCRVESTRTALVFLTRTGEQWPTVWRNLNLSRHPILPSYFPSIVHNSAIGQLSIELSITGPQIALVSGDVVKVAAQQIELGRATHVIVCSYEIGDIARSIIIENNSARVGVPLPRVPIKARENSLNYFQRQFEEIKEKLNGQLPRVHRALG